jgi:hypothetical protein|tara:strand:+ start:288 stop:584 length:297 start_codon:yes stop_codon:yes gene_type:complete
MSRGLVQPLFPNAPPEYDPAFMAEVVAAFSVFLQQVNNPGPWRASAMTLTALQDNDQNLEVGAIYQREGFLKIVLVNLPNPPGVSATASVGSVTVTTT